MLTKCANAMCNARFRYLHEGRLFLVDTSRAKRRNAGQDLQYYWLCPSCSKLMRVVVNSNCEIEVVAIRKSGDSVLRRHRNASSEMDSDSLPTDRKNY